MCNYIRNGLSHYMKEIEHAGAASNFYFLQHKTLYRIDQQGDLFLPYLRRTFIRLSVRYEAEPLLGK